jgi:hypothetical protein
MNRGRKYRQWERIKERKREGRRWENKKGKGKRRTKEGKVG